MARKKEENAFTEAMNAINYLVRHRGPITIPALPGIKGRTIDTIKLGKKTLYLNNAIPALIQDTFANLGYEQKDGTKPVIAAKRKTEYGWHLVVNLPPGVSFKKIKADKDYFQDAVNGWIELEWKSGKCHMNIQTGELLTNIPYQWDAALYSKMQLPIPIGYSRTGLVVLDLPESPHLLFGGATGFGKTNMLRQIVHSIIDRALVVIIDLKRVDFTYLRNHCLLATTPCQALFILSELNKEYDRRIEILLRNNVEKMQECKEELPYIVVIVDELAELDKETMPYLDRLVRLARATGISIIAASQRTSVQVLPGDTRSNFVARLCYKVGTDADSRVILGEDCGLAGQLPGNIKGRAIYRFGVDTIEVQTMNLPVKVARQLALNTPPQQRRWNIEPEPAPVPKAEAKRLRAR